MLRSYARVRRKNIFGRLKIYTISDTFMKYSSFRVFHILLLNHQKLLDWTIQENKYAFMIASIIRNSILLKYLNVIIIEISRT